MSIYNYPDCSSCCGICNCPSTDTDLTLTLLSIEGSCPCFDNETITLTYTTTPALPGDYAGSGAADPDDFPGWQGNIYILDCDDPPEAIGSKFYFHLYCLDGVWHYYITWLRRNESDEYLNCAGFKTVLSNDDINDTVTCPPFSVTLFYGYSLCSDETETCNGQLSFAISE